MSDAEQIKLLKAEIADLRDALEPFAEPPTAEMDEFACHAGICVKEECGRCSRAIRAWRALNREPAA